MSLNREAERVIFLEEHEQKGTGLGFSIHFIFLLSVNFKLTSIKLEQQTAESQLYSYKNLIIKS
jgi:hypothetical protein